MLMRLNAEGEEKVAKPEKVIDATNTQKKLDKAYNLNLIADASGMAANSVNGIFYGAALGLVSTYFLKKNIYYGAAFGALVGGILGYASHQASCD